MHTVYVIYSQPQNRFYIGECERLEERLLQHQTGYFENSYTSRASDWVLHVSIDCSSCAIARKIEAHIKKMKSRKYLQSLKTYPELAGKLLALYEPGSRSR